MTKAVELDINLWFSPSKVVFLLFQLMGSVGSVLTERGLPEPASHLHKCLADISHIPEIDQLRALMDTLRTVPLDDKVLIRCYKAH